MISMNSRMLSQLRCIESRDFRANEELVGIAKKGFVRVGDAILLEAFRNRLTSVPDELRSDSVGVECYCNSIHLDDYTSDRMHLEGIVFSLQLLLEWSRNPILGDAQVIFSCDGEFGNVKIHELISGRQYLSESIEDFDEDILLLDSSVLLFSQSLQLVDGSNPNISSWLSMLLTPPPSTGKANIEAVP